MKCIKLIEIVEKMKEGEIEFEKIVWQLAIYDTYMRKVPGSVIVGLDDELIWARFI